MLSGMPDDIEKGGISNNNLYRMIYFDNLILRATNMNLEYYRISLRTKCPRNKYAM